MLRMVKNRHVPGAQVRGWGGKGADVGAKTQTFEDRVIVIGLRSHSALRGWPTASDWSCPKRRRTRLGAACCPGTDEVLSSLAQRAPIYAGWAGPQLLRIVPAVWRTGNGL